MKFIFAALFSLFISTSALAGQIVVPGNTRPDLAGMRIQGLTNGTVYMVDNVGVLQPISNGVVFSRIFRNWDGIVQADITGYAIGRGIGENGSLNDSFNYFWLVKGNDATVYLLLDGLLHPITGAAFDKYNFNWNTIYVNENTVNQYKNWGAIGGLLQ